MRFLTWYAKRLSVMSMREIVFRCMRVIAQMLERVLLHCLWQPNTLRSVKVNSLFPIPCGAETSVLKTQSTIQVFSPLLANTIEPDEVTIFSKRYPLDLPIAWHTDPSSGIRAPLTYGKGINYRNDAIVGDIKISWELARHQHLVPQVLSYLKTGDVAFRDSVIGQIDDWVSANPYGYGIHWCSALEVALRGIAWSMVNSLLISSGQPNIFQLSTDQEALQKSVYQHSYFIRHHLSLHSSANNHYIGELSGLFVISTAFDFGRQTQKWNIFAINELKSEMVKQNFSDGVNREQALGYQIEVMDYCSFIWAICQGTELEFDSRLRKQIVAMGRFLNAMIPESSLDPPEIGDCDYGTVNDFGQRNLTAADEMASTYSHLFAGKDAHECIKALLYGLIAETNGSVKYKMKPKAGLNIFADGGYAIVRHKDAHLVFSAGSLGYPSIAAHGHADALAFCLAWRGQWWFIDPGTYCYHSDLASRSYFRGTRAHNTVVVDGLDQSEQGGPFLWVRDAHSKLELADELNCEPIEYALRGSHDGYSHLGVGHERTMSFSPSKGEIIIVDDLLINSILSRQVEINFHLHPNISITIDDHMVRAKHRESGDEMHIRLSESLTWHTYHGSQDPIAGWFSPMLGTRIPTNTIRGVCELREPMQLKTEIYFQE